MFALGTRLVFEEVAVSTRLLPGTSTSLILADKGPVVVFWLMIWLAGTSSVGAVGGEIETLA